MIVRKHPEGHLCIPQSQHAAISGQIAEAWGGPLVAHPDPAEGVRLAAAHHDDGMDPLDAEPPLDPETGLPCDFMHLELETWIGCWDRGPAQVAEINPYAGLLVSLHGEHLLGYRRIDPADNEARAMVSGWRAQQRELRISLQTLLAEGVGTGGPLIDEAQLERNRKLIEIWDAMSLAICMPRLPESFEIPSQTGEALTIGFAEGEAGVQVDPWPFAVGAVRVSATGRLLHRTFGHREDLLAALRDADERELCLELHPIER